MVQENEVSAAADGLAHNVGAEAGRKPSFAARFMNFLGRLLGGARKHPEEVRAPVRFGSDTGFDAGFSPSTPRMSAPVMEEYKATGPFVPFDLGAVPGGMNVMSFRDENNRLVYNAEGKPLIVSVSHTMRISSTGKIDQIITYPEASMRVMKEAGFDPQTGQQSSVNRDIYLTVISDKHEVIPARDANGEPVKIMAEVMAGEGGFGLVATRENLDRVNAAKEKVVNNHPGGKLWLASHHNGSLPLRDTFSMRLIMEGPQTGQSRHAAPGQRRPGYPQQFEGNINGGMVMPRQSAAEWQAGQQRSAAPSVPPPNIPKGPSQGHSGPGH